LFKNREEKKKRKKKRKICKAFKINSITYNFNLNKHLNTNFQYSSFQKSNEMKDKATLTDGTSCCFGDVCKIKKLKTNVLIYHSANGDFQGR